MKKVEPTFVYTRQCASCGMDIFPHYHLCGWCEAEKKERAERRARALRLALANRRC